MGTSRRRTPPAPVSAEPPKGARTAYRGMPKTRKSDPGFKRPANFFAVTWEGRLVLALRGEVPQGAGNLRKTVRFSQEQPTRRQIALTHEVPARGRDDLDRRPSAPDGLGEPGAGHRTPAFG